MIHRRMILVPLPVCGSRGKLTLSDRWEDVTCKKCLVYQRPIILTDRNLIAGQLDEAVALLKDILESETHAPGLTTKQAERAREIIARHQ